MHSTIARAACGSAGGPLEPRACAVLVPSRGAAEALRRTLENLQLTDGSPALILPDLLTRAELYERLHQRVRGVPRLTDFEREVIFRRAAADAASQGTPAPFRLRPGLIVEILAFYDELRRRDKTIAAFDRLMTASLESSAEIDRGADRMLRLTRFLSAAFTLFEDARPRYRECRRAWPACAAALARIGRHPASLPPRRRDRAGPGSGLERPVAGGLRPAREIAGTRAAGHHRHRERARSRVPPACA